MAAASGADLPEAPHAVFVGSACLDTILTVTTMPEEDTEVRCSGRLVRQGGNACNSASVCALLGTAAAWIGTTVDEEVDDAARTILSAMRACDVDVRGAAVHATGSVPMSYIISVAGGSRTIIHHRELEELTAAEFCTGLGALSGSEGSVPKGLRWAHLECRGDIAASLIPNLGTLQDARLHDPEARGFVMGNLACPVTCVELEKARDGEETSHRLAQVVVVSSEWVRARLPPTCCGDPVAALKAVSAMSLPMPGSDAAEPEEQFARDAVVILTNGADGTYVAPRIGDLRRCDTVRVVGVDAVAGAAKSLDTVENATVVHVRALRLSKEWLEAGDSIGAGDSFAAGLVHAACASWRAGAGSDRARLEEVIAAVKYASRVAAAKLGTNSFRRVPEKLAVLLGHEPSCVNGSI